MATPTRIELRELASWAFEEDSEDDSERVVRSYAPTTLDYTDRDADLCTHQQAAVGDALDCSQTLSTERLGKATGHELFSSDLNAQVASPTTRLSSTGHSLEAIASPIVLGDAGLASAGDSHARLVSQRAAFLLENDRWLEHQKQRALLDSRRRLLGRLPRISPTIFPTGSLASVGQVPGELSFPCLEALMIHMYEM